MATLQSTHHFPDTAASHLHGLLRYVLKPVRYMLLRLIDYDSKHSELIIRQGPKNARVAVGKEKGAAYDIRGNGSAGI